VIFLVSIVINLLKSQILQEKKAIANSLILMAEALVILGNLEINSDLLVKPKQDVRLLKKKLGANKAD